MADLTASCPSPFVDETKYPYTGGFYSGRYCGNVTATLSCCLPCPLEDWVYSDRFERDLKTAYWFNVPALVCQVLLLVTYAVLPQEKSHRHYLSVGLCVSLILLELSFIIPLGTRPNKCHDPVTPNDMRSNMSCAWSGALLEAGAMAGIVWILLRSLWTHVRVCYAFEHSSIYVWIGQAVGWGLPAIFLAISLPITGVSYRFGTTCFPNEQNAFVTWFGWLMAFALLAALIQVLTTAYCLGVYLRNFLQYRKSSSASSGTLTSDTGDAASARGSSVLSKRLAWRRVSKVLVLQWRSIILSLFVIVDIVYFSTVYVLATRAVKVDQQPARVAQIEQWSLCLVLNNGDKNKCLGDAKVVGLSETTVIATFFMSALVGIFTFALMLRSSMLIGWYELVIHRGRTQRPSVASDNFELTNSRRKSSARAAGPAPRSTEQRPSEESPLTMPGVLPTPTGSVHRHSYPEPGDVTQRHETVDYFDDEAYEEAEKERRKAERRQLSLDDEV